MCGIAGYVGGEVSQQIIQGMTDRIFRRGPDAEGFWLDPEHSIAFGHRRLSIIDLSEAGAQPMTSHNGRWVIIFNGEIYNYNELKTKLPGINWRGHSDTEVILEAFSLWGVERALKELRGMFALALWDKEEKKFFLARDRMGEKPLYYGFLNNVFYFGSDINVLSGHPKFKAQIDRKALASYFRYGYVPAPFSIYENIYKLLPAHFLEINYDDMRSGNYVSVPYWDLKDYTPMPLKDSENTYVDELHDLLKKSIAEQMISDVPLGAFLSGGIDSSSVVGIMQSLSSKPVKTFTIGFNVKEFNEAQFAKEISQHLGTNHTELYLDSADVMNVIDEMPQTYSEPFADVSQLPTFLVAKLARQKVTVSLSGDAGDELFCGYHRYFWSKKIWNTMNRIPMLNSGLTKKILRQVPSGLYQPLGKAIKIPLLKDKVDKLDRLLGSKNEMDLYHNLISIWEKDSLLSLVKGVSSYPEVNGLFDLENLSFEDRMMYVDSYNYLPDDILVKLDRATMANSLESRVPFLDYRVVEFARKLPIDMKVRSGQGKWILRQILYKYVPKNLVERPKMGFAVPIDRWLRNELKDWAYDLICKIPLDDFLDFDTVLKKWNEHQSGKNNWQYQIWTILMFQLWLENTKVSR